MVVKSRRVIQIRSHSNEDQALEFLKKLHEVQNDMFRWLAQDEWGNSHSQTRIIDGLKEATAIAKKMRSI